jgi:hypothetical protein
MKGWQTMGFGMASAPPHAQALFQAARWGRNEVVPAHGHVLHYGHVSNRIANADSHACHVRLRSAVLLPGLTPARQPRRRNLPRPPPRRHAMNPITEHTPFLRLHVDLPLSASDRCTRMPALIRPAPHH